jgi:hypothetical protein
MNRDLNADALRRQQERRKALNDPAQGTKRIQAFDKANNARVQKYAKDFAAKLRDRVRPPATRTASHTTGGETAGTPVVTPVADSDRMDVSARVGTGEAVHRTRGPLRIVFALSLLIAWLAGFAMHVGAGAIHLLLIAGLAMLVSWVATGRRR